MRDSAANPGIGSARLAGGAVASPGVGAARLMAGGLSLLLVLAFALAAGVPAGQLLATVSGGGVVQGETDLAVAPQVVERESRRLAQERPVPALGFAAGLSRGVEGLAGGRLTGRGISVRAGGGGLVREALLALPPPAIG